MSVVELLMDTAVADTELLRKNDAMGDILGRPRDVDFVLIARDAEKAKTVASFLYEYQYGRTRTEPGPEGTTRILVTIRMPMEQHLLCSVSGFMACVSHLYGIEYDGWGCEVQKAT